MRNNLKISLLVLLMATTLEVWSQRNFHKQNFAEMYNNNSIKLHPVYQCYHNNDTSSTVFYQIDLSELFYIPNEDSVYSAQAQIHYEVYYNYKAKELLDSGSVYLLDSANFGKDNSSIGFFHIPLASNYQYLIYITLTDINNKYNVKTLLDINKLVTKSRQNFYIRGTDGLPFLQSYINRNQSFELVSERNNESDIHIRYFKSNNSIAKPPMYGSERLKRTVHSDTTYHIPMDNGYSNILQLQDQGYYHFHYDSTDSKGFTVFQFTNNYPYITSPMQMLMPLRYITSKTEFKALLNSKDKKKAVEDFWVQISGNEERAVNMIKLYYNRVQNANLHFASDKEGWMTDRGMVYIVFGAPDIVYQDRKMETWKYGSPKNNKSITFNFYKVENPFTPDDYMMDRSNIYGVAWNNAIEIWRR